MKHGRTLNELAIEIQRQQDNKRDFIIDAPKINAFVHPLNNVLELGFPINAAHELFTAPLTANGHIQLGQYCDIPKKYYDKVNASSPALLANNVKHWLDHSSDRRMVRSLDGNIRAFLSDKYRRLDNYDLVQHILPILYDAGVTIESCEVTDNKLYIKAITHKVQGEVNVGEVVCAGICVSNSETGNGAISVKPLVYKYACKNGLIVDALAMRKYHAGRAAELEQIEFSNETLLALDFNRQLIKCSSVFHNV